MIGIYKITNTFNSKVYIGQSVDIKKRFTAHVSSAINEFNKSYDYLLPRAIRKYGLDNFKFEVLEECLKEELNNKEVYWISYYDATNPEKGYNNDLGGSFKKPVKLSEEDLELLIYDLEHSRIEQKDLALKYNISYYYVSDINIGRQRRIEGRSYPIRKPLSELNTICPICGGYKDKDANICLECYNLSQRKVERPDVMTLAQDIVSTNFSATGRKYGVSDNAIRKWCVSYGIPKTKKELKEWLNSNTI